MVYDELEDKTVIRRLADSGIFIAFVCYFMVNILLKLKKERILIENFPIQGWFFWLYCIL